MTEIPNLPETKNSPLLFFRKRPAHYKSERASVSRRGPRRRAATQWSSQGSVYWLRRNKEKEMKHHVGEQCLSIIPNMRVGFIWLWRYRQQGKPSNNMNLESYLNNPADPLTIYLCMAEISRRTVAVGRISEQSTPSIIMLHPQYFHRKCRLHQMTVCSFPLIEPKDA